MYIAHYTNSPCKKPQQWLGFLLIFFVLISVVHPVFATQESTPVTSKVEFPRETVLVKNKDGDIAFTTEIASSPEQLAQGLMYREKIGENEAMIFLFHDQAVGMWMKNTLIPLDMLFIDKTGRIIHIARNTTPNSLTTISAGLVPIRAVMEIKGNIAAERNIQVGDKVAYKVFEK